MNARIPTTFPAQGGALDGHILTDEEIHEMDRRIIWTAYRRVSLPQPLPPLGRPVGAALH